MNRRDGDAISAATPTFSTMPDSDMPLTAWPKVARHRLFPFPVCIAAIFGPRCPRSGHVDRGISTSGMVEIVGVAIEISLLSHAIPEIQCTSGIYAAILFFGCRRMSVNVDDVTIELGMVENLAVAVGISLITCSRK